MGRSEARCRAAQQSFEAGLFGNLDSGDRLALREHLVGCEACRRRARLLTARLENLADFDLTGLMELRLRWQAELDQRRSGPLMILGALVLCLSWLSAGVFFAARPSEEQREAGRPDSEIAPIDSAQAASVESVRGAFAGSIKVDSLGIPGPELSSGTAVDWTEVEQPGGVPALEFEDLPKNACRGRALEVISGYCLGPAWSAGPVQFGFIVDLAPGSGLGVMDSVAVARVAEREAALPHRIVVQSLAWEIVWPPAWMIEAPWGWRISREAFFGASSPRELAVQGVEDTNLLIARAEAAETLRWRPVLRSPIAAPRAVRLALYDGADSAELRCRLLPQWNARGMSRAAFSENWLPERILRVHGEVLRRASRQRGLRGLVLHWNGGVRSVDVFSDAASAFAASAALLQGLIFELADSEIERLSGAGDWRVLDSPERTVLEDFFRRGLVQIGLDPGLSSDSAAELSCDGGRFAFFRLARD